MIKKTKKVNVKIQIIALHKKKETISVPYQYNLQIFTNKGTTHTFEINVQTVIGLVENGVEIENVFPS